MAREPLAVTLNTLHNVTYYETLMARMREAINNDTFAAFAISETWSGSSKREEAAWPT
jgi:tRNA-guanine family transglycosylase